jgi:D-glycero-alpha-D-manno-heptose-7-phosphate kinase
VKRDLSRDVSNAYLDDLYEHARAAGAVGGKVIGAGGGGFIVLFVPPSLQQRVRDALCRLIQVPFRFESSGSQIIFHDPEQDYSAEERFRASQSVDGFRELRELQRAAGDGRRSAKAAARLRRSVAPAREA